MADILIRGMEMPKSCDECRLFNESWCMALGVENWRKSYNKPPEGGRLPDCPLVPLPEGHGRLIDADALIENHFSDEHRIALSPANKLWMRRIIKGEPTIIEAEGGTDDDGNA